MDSESAVHIAAVRKALINNTAAVMIGAGFSRNAEGGEQLKLWNELARELWSALNPENTNRDDFLASSVTQLASQYAQIFSLPALEDLLKKHIPDEKVKPGKLHIKLLNLNWSEIFTTNYDTLLERAAEEIIERSHFTVTCREDIPQSKTLGRRRIVKLHGSFPSQRPFIFTEEQYRCYPSEFAPFVNLVRQSMLENIFCLIGFSGDDPNFLQWIGWVRDMLDEHALPIYLFVSKPISLGQRKLLEARKVTPVLLPMGPETDETDYQERYKLLLEMLDQTEKEDEGNSWIDSVHLKELSDESDATSSKAKIILANIVELTKLKRNYPGWIVCPFAVRRRLSTKVHPIAYSLHSKDAYIEISSGSPLISILALNFYAWWTETRLRSLDDHLATYAYEILIKTLKIKFDFKDEETRILAASLDISTRKKFLEHWFELAIRVLRWSREEQNSKKFQSLKSLIEASGDINSVTIDEVKYETILYAIQEGDRELAARLAIEWSPVSNETYMEIRKGSLLAEVGEIALGLKTCARGLQNLRKGQKIRNNSVKLLSEESWAALVIKNIKDAQKFSQEFAEHNIKSPISHNTEEHDDALSSDINHNRARTTNFETILPKDSDDDDGDHITKRIDSRISELESKGFKAEKERDIILSDLDVEVSYSSEKLQIVNSFEFGRYFNRDTYGFVNNEHNKKTSAAFKYLKLTDITATPPILGNLSILPDSYIQAAWWIRRQDSFTRALSTALRTLNSSILEPHDPTKPPYKSGWLSRYQVGTIDEAAALSICNKALDIIDNYLTRPGTPKQRTADLGRRKYQTITIFCEVFSRLVIRITDKELISNHISRIINLHKSQELWSQPNLWKSFGNALCRSLEASDASTREKFIVDILSIPLIPPEGGQRFLPNHLLRDWLNTDQLVSVLDPLKPNKNAAIQNEIERIITNLLNEPSDQLKEKLWSRIFILDRMDLITTSDISKLSKTIWINDGWPIIPGFRKVASLALLSKESEMIKKLHFEPIRDFSSVAEETDPPRRTWSLSEDESTLDCWIYLAQKYKLSTHDASIGIANIKAWWEREWKIILENRNRIEELKPIIAHRLTAIDSFLALALPKEWHKLDVFSQHVSWIKSLPKEAQKFDVEMWRIQLKFKLKNIHGAGIGDIENEVATALLGDASSPQFLHAINTARDWIRVGWFSEAKAVVDAAITLMYSKRRISTAWGLEILLNLIITNAEIITQGRFKRIEKGLALLLETANYKAYHFPYEPFNEDIPVIRYSCCRISLELTKDARYKHSKILEKWISEIDSDPLPEMRYLSKNGLEHHTAPDND